MAEVDPSRLTADNQLLLDQPLLRLPLELQRRYFKRSQQWIDHEQKQVLNQLKDATKKADNQSSDQTLRDIDNMIKRMENLKRKLEQLNADEESLLQASNKRIQHLQELYEIPSLTDVKYDQWSRTRLDRLVVDYLLRNGYPNTASILATTRDITSLIDLDTFISCHKISDSIQRGQTADALTWVKDNRDGLKKLLEKDAAASAATTVSGIAKATSPGIILPKITALEFELRFQEYIELLRQSFARPDAKFDAVMHVQKYLKPHEASFPTRVSTAVGLLAQNPHSPENPYSDYFLPTRWTYLSTLFIETHHTMLSLPTRPLLHVALSAGLSALKTPACHSAFNPASSVSDSHPKLASSTTTTQSQSRPSHHPTLSPTGLCPICSTELNDLARTVPYAHHTKSYVEPDAVVLPNGRIYGRSRLEELQRKMLRAQGLLGTGVGVGEELVGRNDQECRDPVTGDAFLWGDVSRVFVS